MGEVEYLRQFSCVVANASGSGLEFNQFRCQFVVRRGDLQTPNSCDVRIYNLGNDTVNRIQAEFTQIQILAGYPGTYDLIFKGAIKQIRLGRQDGIDSYLDITAADGDEAYNFAVVSASLAAASTTPGSVADALYNALSGLSATQSITQGYSPTWPTDALPRGRVLYGLARDELRDFSSSNAVSWSIQDGALNFIPYKSYKPGTVPVIGPGTGLVGVPEQQIDGIHFRCLLNPLIKIGQLVKLDCTVNLYRFGLSLSDQTNNALLQSVVKISGDGTYYVLNVSHSGDTRGQEWYTDAVCLATDATLINLQVTNALVVQSADVVLGGTPVS